MTVTTPTSEVIRNDAAFIWSVADLLRGDYKQFEYGKVILPMVVLRRLDCVLEPTKEGVLARHGALKAAGSKTSRCSAPSRGSSSTTHRSWTCRSCLTIRRTSRTTCTRTSKAS